MVGYNVEEMGCKAINEKGSCKGLVGFIELRRFKV